MMDVKHCRGCRNDFYNRCWSRDTAGRCWSRDTAKMVWRIAVGMWENPPYLKKKKQRVPDCWHGEGNQRTLYVKPEAIGSDGYWRH